MNKKNIIPRFAYHLHSDMSNIRIIDAINKPEEIIQYALEIGLSGICFCEHEHLGNSIILDRLKDKYKEKYPEFKIAHGNEIYLTNDRSLGQKYYHFILIALDAIGFQMLSELSSNAWLNSYYDRGILRVPTLKSELENIIEKYGQNHIVGSTACLGGELSTLILQMHEAEILDNYIGRKEAHDNIVEFIQWNKTVFGQNNFYLEVQPGITKEQHIVSNMMVKLASVFNIPVCITDDAHFLKKEDRLIHKAFLNSKDSERETDFFYQSCWLHTEEEMIEAIKDTELNYNILCKNSMDLMSRIQDYSLQRPQEIPEAPVEYFPIESSNSHIFQKYPSLDKLSHSDNEQERAWVNLCYQKLVEKKLNNSKYLQRLDEEADTQLYIGEKLNTCIFAYPLFLRHYINLIWDCGSTIGTGRGSAGGGLSHWLLGITQTDPIKTKSYFWRFLNKERYALPDIDIDICPSKRELALDKMREELGELGCVHVCTYSVLSTKAAIKTAARGYRNQEYPDGIPLEEAEYLSGLIPSERGFLWPLKDLFFGNKERNRTPNNKFIQEINNYPGLQELLLKIEGLIVQAGIHASGVIYPPKDNYYKYGPFMKAKNGMIVTQYALSDAEAAGATKIDWLVTEVQQIFTDCIQELQQAGYIKPSLTLREAYESYLAPEALPLEDSKLWDALDKADILKVFQLDSQVGRQGVKKIQPRSVEELTAVNALIRLMAEDGEESPMDKYIRYKKDVKLWCKEMSNYGLTPQEQQYFEPYLSESYGICYSQEQLMMVLMDKNICNFSLGQANSARKLISKKLMNKIPEFKKEVYQAASSKAVAHYTWDMVVKPSLGYSFARVHGYSYSLIGCQCVYLATYFPQVYWNTACLRVDAGIEEDDSSNYAKVAKAIGNMVSNGIKVLPIDINKSNYLFEPDEKNNAIYYGFKGLTGVGGEAIQEIIENRPYISIEDFESKVSSANKTMIIALIKSGAFDQFGERKELMEQYLRRVSEPKKRITLQNFKGLMDLGLLPQELEFQRRLFVFNKALRAKKKVKDYYVINYNYYDFYEKFFDLDLLEPYEGTTAILQKTWQKLYTKGMEPAKKYFQERQQELLDAYNNILFQEQWDKYAKGTYSTWEMDSLGYYYHSHELADVNLAAYGVIPYSSLTTEPKVEYTFKREGREIPIYELSRIAGTVIGKNNTKATVDILTVDSGVITVKFNLEYFAKYNRRISDIVDGENKVVENGWFTRGSILVLTGWRNGDMFRCRTRKKSPYPQLCKVTKINGQFIEMTDKRYGED